MRGQKTNALTDMHTFSRNKFVCDESYTEPLHHGGRPQRQRETTTKTTETKYNSLPDKLQMLFNESNTKPLFATTGK